MRGRADDVVGTPFCCRLVELQVSATPIRQVLAPFPPRHTPFWHLGSHRRRHFVEHGENMPRCRPA